MMRVSRSPAPDSYRPPRPHNVSGFSGEPGSPAAGQSHASPDARFRPAAVELTHSCVRRQTAVVKSGSGRAQRDAPTSGRRHAVGSRGAIDGSTESASTHSGGRLEADAASNLSHPMRPKGSVRARSRSRRSSAVVRAAAPSNALIKPASQAIRNSSSSAMPLPRLASHHGSSSRSSKVQSPARSRGGVQMSIETLRDPFASYHLAVHHSVVGTSHSSDTP